MGLFERISKGRLYRVSISVRFHHQAEFCTVIPQFSLVWNVSLWVDVISLTTAAQTELECKMYIDRLATRLKHFCRGIHCVVCLQTEPFTLFMRVNR